MASKMFISALCVGLVMSAAPAFAQKARNQNSNDRSVSVTTEVTKVESNRAQTNWRNPRNQRANQRRGYSRIINRQVFDTRYRARIVLTEQRLRTRRGARLVCTVDAKGPQARLVSKKRMRRIARNNCSRRAKINIYR